MNVRIRNSLFVFGWMLLLMAYWEFTYRNAPAVTDLESLLFMVSVGTEYSSVQLHGTVLAWVYTSLMPMYSGLDNLKILAAINHKISVEQIRNIIKEVGLNPDDRANVRQYSLGMKQKLSIAQAIMEDPSLLLLDEPTNALDDQSVHRIREILLKRREEGATILIASHNKEDLQVLADEVVEMADGRIQEDE